MSSNLRDLIEGEAELDDEEDDESFDEDTGETRRKERSGRIDDSSEEEDDDDDEEEVRKVQEGFIVEDEDEEDEDPSDVEDRPVIKRKREARDREEDKQLDEDDLDLIGEQLGDWRKSRDDTQPKLKRLKQGHRGEAERRNERPGLDEIFDDDEDEQERPYGGPFRPQDEFEDFIEEDSDDEDERRKQREDFEVARPTNKTVGGVVDATGLDNDAIEDMEAIFASGEDYEWAFMREEMGDEREDEQAIELKDVFEPSQLTEKMLTEEDNEIRFTDEPERFQLDRKPFRAQQIQPDLKEEARWIADLMAPKKRTIQADLIGPFTKAVGKVLEFFIIDDVEVPFVFHHRKDYLIHARRARGSGRDRDEAPEQMEAEKLLTQEDLWRILELDIKFRSLLEKRNALEKTFHNLREALNVEDEILTEMIPKAVNMEELQDLQDYLHFQYSAELKDLASMARNSGQSKRPMTKSSLFERVRKGKAHQFVRAYGITADQLAKNVIRLGPKVSPDDDSQYPMDLADSLTDGEFPTGDGVMLAARQTFSEELFMSPRLRKHFREVFYSLGQFSCRRTDKGLRKIDDAHPFYEVKYLINQTIFDIVRQPELYLKMMKAEEDGLVEITISMQNERELRKQLYQEFASENFSEKAEKWQEERKKVIDAAFPKLERVIAKGIKDVLRTECQEQVLGTVREEYFRRLDQTPYKPKALEPGVIPRCLILSAGMGDPARDPICWVCVEEDGRVRESGKFSNLGRDEGQRDELVSLVQKLGPDVIGVSGWSADAYKLVRDLESIVSEKGLLGYAPEPDDDGDDVTAEPLEVVVVNDEVARLYKDSPRAVAELPSLNPIARYCVALARYMQNPMKEYAALGRDVASLSLHPCQHLLPADKVVRNLETAMVDMVNLCGVNLNEAVSDPYTQNLLPYVAGLGPRKVSSVLKAIHANGGTVSSRDELVGDPDSGKLPVVGPKVWNNCASFLFIEYDPLIDSSDPLDNTRVHPEDYELGRKMAADALELDEEDVKVEVDENGAGAIVRKLFKQGEQEKVNELVLEEYAEQLERNYSQRKRATLENIRAELQAPYEELRKSFSILSPSEIFTIFTGETATSLCRDMIVPVNVRLVKEDFAIVKLDSGIEGRIEAHEVTHRVSIKEVLQVGQTVQAKILEISHKDFIAKLTVKEEALRKPFRRQLDHSSLIWDYDLERRDKEDLQVKDRTTGRTQRVINHPLFKPFNSTQAEEYLGSRPTGEVVIRPSSRGNDHLAVTWKVADGVYQHIDVLELDKENEFSVGRTLRVGGKYTYTDLDELIVDHVKAMSKKVDELMQHEKFQNRARADLDKWLTTYVDANPNRSAYAFCLQTKHPGYFWLCFKASRSSKVLAWPVKVVPHAYELRDTKYPDMRALCNGFKLRYQNEMTRMQSRR